MESEKDKNLRQLHIMLRKILDFKEDKTYLKWLIDDLDGLYRIYNTTNKFWSDKFHENWLDLEIIYASAMSSNLNEVPQNETKDVMKAIHNLEKIIKKEICYCNSAFK